MEQKGSQESRLKTAYKILSWVVLACVLLIVLVVLHKSPPPVVTTDPTAATRAQQKLAAADEAKSEGQPAQVQLDSTELNSYLAQNLQIPASPATVSDSPAANTNAAGTASVAPSTNGSPAALPDTNRQEPSLGEVQSSVRGVQVDMDGDLIKAYVIFDLHGQDLSLELDGHLGSENGYMKFEPVSGKLGSLPLPQSMLDAVVDQLMNSPENKEKLRLPQDVSDIQIRDGHAVVSYK